ncbi:hypothetical protein MYSTI_02130 [Myxococcus stipitatus DSM 14675]|uniref:Uncharacterized protein n=1 Tax=Myxococcus stipitatus (strain DSM 14675 / JCM 12634 / Mx s8) TaxID=1278073 RepID=L7U7D2_MYXSD|nr:hypothetical protein [Myxococcus stipitatus]AGC43457.1 hypothetical protein MYSTI_02130 [Myxococcus stipitatus DSM 14675]
MGKDNGSGANVSRRGFEKEVFTVIRSTARVSDKKAPDDLLRNMVAMWISDVMNSADLEKMGWWAELEAWSNKKDKAKPAAAFLKGLLKTFTFVIEDYRATLPAMLAQFEKDMAVRYSAIPRYYEFIQALQQTIWANVPVICYIGGHASGDMFGIGASALLKESMGVVVYKADKIEQDHSDGMLSFFSELLGASRVRLAESYQEAVSRDSTFNGVFELMRTRRAFAWLAPYNMGTYFLRSQFQLGGSDCLKVEENRGVIRQAFHVERIKHEDALRRYLAKHLGNLSGAFGRKVLVLWSRFTGKKGEYHPEHDTSFKGLAQMAWMAAELDYTVIIAGDRPIVHEQVIDKDARRKKYDEIVGAVNECYGNGRCVNLTEFWTDPDWKHYSGGKRVVQFQLYELLHRLCDVRHLGMRSGNLEALALLGYFVRYMEEEQSYGGERMVAWHQTGIGYERILLSEPPTRVGKYIHHDLKLNKSGLFKMGVLQASMPPYITARNRGIPGTASRFKPNFADELKEMAESQKEALDKIPPEKRELPKAQQARALSNKREELSKNSEKPGHVRKYESGFVDEDLLKILAYLREENPCLVPAKRRPTGNPEAITSAKQLLLMQEIRKLLVRAVTS